MPCCLHHLVRNLFWPSRCIEMPNLELSTQIASWEKRYHWDGILRAQGSSWWSQAQWMPLRRAGCHPDGENQSGWLSCHPNMREPIRSHAVPLELACSIVMASHPESIVIYWCSQNITMPFHFITDVLVSYPTVLAFLLLRSCYTLWFLDSTCSLGSAVLMVKS